MHNRFAAEGKPGATERSGAPYSTWWNGGLRSTTGFHNMIGLLTESIGNPTPIEIPFLPNKLLPRADQAYPIAPQKWHFAQSIAYELTANRAVLDVASRYRETFLYNIYEMGRNSIERGSTDTWTVISPEEVAHEALAAILSKDQKRFEALLMTNAELNALGLPPAEAQKTMAIVRDAMGMYRLPVKTR